MTLPYPPPFAAQVPAPVSPFVVERDAACRKCSYNLRGLSSDGRCPECGTPVGLSLHGDLLRFSDPAWLETLRKGINCIIACVVIMIGAAVLSAALPSVVGRSTAELLGAIVSLGGWGLYVLGAWFLTMPDPSGIGEDQYGTSRKIIRIALAVGLVNQGLTLALQSEKLPPGLALSVGALALLAGLVGVVGQFAQLNYLEKLARRIPDQRLSERAHFLKWALGIDYAVLLLFIALGTAMMISTGTRSAGAGGLAAIGCVAAIAGIALLIFGIMYLLMLEKLGKRFKEQAVFARQTWAMTAARQRPPA